MTSDVLSYFAYGSNMFSPRLRERCLSASPLGRVAVAGFELRWHKRSTDGSGKCDIYPVTSQSALIHGVLYQIDASELGALDKAEGRGKGYERIEVSVVVDGSQRSVITYQATEIDDSLRPYSWYHALVVAGAREHGLLADYVAQLEAVITVKDPDPKRHRSNMALIK